MEKADPREPPEAFVPTDPMEAFEPTEPALLNVGGMMMMVETVCYFKSKR
jgi:hypothetical protein